MTKYKKKWKCRMCQDNVAAFYVYICHRLEPEIPKESTKVSTRAYLCYDHFMTWITNYVKTTPIALR